MTNLRLRSRIVSLAAAVVVVATLPALAASAETPEAFVRRVYTKQYKDDGKGVSTDRPAGAAFYTAALLDEFAKDRELAHGEVGAIDSDPVCDCQDWGKLRIRHLAVTPGAAGSVTARVDLTNLGSQYTLSLTLPPTPAGRRSADVGSKDTPSLLAYLRKSNAHPAWEDTPDAAKPAAQPPDPKATPPKP